MNSPYCKSKAYALRYEVSLFWDVTLFSLYLQRQVMALKTCT